MWEIPQSGLCFHGRTLTIQNRPPWGTESEDGETLEALCVAGWSRRSSDVQKTEDGVGSAPMTLPSLEIKEADLRALARRGAPTWGLFRPFQRVGLWLARTAYFFVFRMLSRPCGIRTTMWIAERLRGIHPIPKGFGFAVPLRADALRDTLNRPEDFNGAEAMTLRLPAGEVVLGIDWGRRHFEERARLEYALDSQQCSDDARIRKIVRNRCDRVMPATLTDLSKVNFARLFEDIALDVAEGHLGVGTYVEVQRCHLRPIIRSLASRVFLAPVPHSAEDLIATVSADKMRSLVEHCVTLGRDDLKARGGHTSTELTVLQRLLMLVDVDPDSKPVWLTEDWVVRNMITLSVFGSVTSARAMTQAMPQMLKSDLRRKLGIEAANDYAALESGRAPSSAGKAATLEAARTNLLKIVFEALRFHPMLSMLGTRTAMRDTVIAPGTDVTTSVKAGTKVMPLLLGAMHDPETFERPHDYCPFKRETADHLHFGAGPHECVGRRMAEIQMEEIAYALFSHPVIRDNHIQCGRIGYDGPAVTELNIRHTPC